MYKKLKYLFTLSFTVLYALYYFAIVWLFFSVDSGQIGSLMHVNFFINQVVFILLASILVLKKYRVNNKIIYISGTVIFFFLSFIYLLAYNDFFVFPIISSILINIGLVLSGSVVLIIYQIKEKL